jgi:hypothetical protein
MKKLVCHFHTEELNYKGSDDINGIIRSHVSSQNNSYDTLLCPNFDVPGGNAYFIGAMFMTNSKTTEQLLW